MSDEYTEDEKDLEYIFQNIHLVPEKERKALLARIERVAIQKARISFKDYAKFIGPALNPDFTWGRHLEILCDRLQKAFERAWLPSKEQPTDRFQASLCPGASKSETVTRLFPSWCLGVNPKTRFIIVGHGIQFATDEYGEKIRDIMWSNEYKRIFPEVELRPDKQAAGRFLTTKGGEVICTGIDAKVAGRRCHILLTDDAIVEEDAYSKAVREKLVKGYPSKHRSRLYVNYAGAEILVGTRWIAGDLHDYLKEIDKNSASPWDCMVIPALLDEDGVALLRRSGDPEGLYELDTSFWPEFQPTNRLRSIRASYENNMQRWNATYMQRPTTTSGRFMARADFQTWAKLGKPDIHTIITSLDTAYTEKEQSDYSAHVTAGIFTSNSINYLILLSYGKKKLTYPKMIDWVGELQRKLKPDFFLIEERSSGLALIPDLRKRGYPVAAWSTRMDKHARMHAASPIVQSGRIFVPKPVDAQGLNAAPQVTLMSEGFLDEVCGYPDLPHDDVADAFSQLVLYLMEKGMLIPEEWSDVEERLNFEDDDDEDDIGYEGKTYSNTY